MKKIGIVALLSSSLAFGDIFIDPPFIRAKGMAEAVTAVGGDISALYYNPAALVNFSITQGKPISFFSADYSLNEYISFVDKNDLKENGYGAQVGVGYSHSSFGAGVAYYTLSQVNYRCNANSIGSYCTQRIYMLHGGFGFKLFKVKATGTGFAVGTSVFWAPSQYDEYFYNSFAGGYEKANSDLPLDGGFGFSVGALLRLFETNFGAIDLGASFRSKADIYEESGGTKKQNFLDVPKAQYVGASIKTFLPIGALIVSYDRQTHFYSENDIKWPDITRQALGVELATPRVVLRGGLYRDDYTKSRYDYETTGYTGGITIKIGKLLLSGAVDKKSTDFITQRGTRTVDQVAYYIGIDFQF